MKKKGLILILLSLVFLSEIYSQRLISGKVINENGIPIAAVSIGWRNHIGGTSSNESGFFQLPIPLADSLVLIFSHISYKRKEVSIDIYAENIEVILELKSELLDEVSIQDRGLGSESGLITISPKSIEAFPAPTGDFLNFIKTLPGVVSNNELSSSYSVRGGNLDENMILVNGIPVYRPFLIANGQQEGLSFIVPEFTKNIKLYTGAWQAKYGNKLSSVLEVDYRRPKTNELTASAGLLGSSVQAGFKKGAIDGLVSLRYKSTRYLLNTFETKGEYQPSFIDYQSIFTFEKSQKTTVQWLSVYSRNKYRIYPTSRVTEFGTSQIPLRLFVAFVGNESVEYQTFQSGLRIKHLISKNWLTDFVISGITTSESEDTNIEGGYRLCDIDKDPSSTTYNDCLVTRGIGTNFKYARNALNANILDIRLNNVHLNNAGNMEWEWGVQINSADFDDELNEYSFVDSADYITNFESAVANNILVNTSFAGYLQTKYYFESGSTLEGGIRFIRPRLTDEVLVAPRLYFKLPTEINGIKVTFHSGAGVHYQPSFYREFRESNGNLNYLNSSTQSSFHLVGGLDMNLKIWDRPFNFVSEVYYKYLWNIIPYDIDNIKIRYLPSYSGTAYATGLDSRFGGEFIPGTESWFSLSILSTKEKLDNTNNTFIRRPSDQRVTFGLYFQDHFPENPNMKVSINLQFGTGLPFGPPGNVVYRSYFTGEMYKRIDLGFTRDIIKEKYKAFLSLEILNLLGSDNTITYSWVEDVSGRQIAIPNALSARFFNFKIGFTI